MTTPIRSRAFTDRRQTVEGLSEQAQCLGGGHERGRVRVRRAGGRGRLLLGEAPENTGFLPLACPRQSFGEPRMRDRRAFLPTANPDGSRFVQRACASTPYSPYEEGPFNALY